MQQNKKKIKQIQKSTSGTITGPGHLHHDFQFLQLTVLQFWKGKMGFGSLMWWEVRCRVAGLDGIGRESERVELKGVMSQGRVIDIMTFNSYSLQYYSFWKGKIGFGFLKHEDCSCFLDNANSHQALQYNNITVSKNDFCVTVDS